MRESLWDQIKDLDPIDLYVTTNAEKIKVTNKVHSWIEDPIAIPTSGQGTVELADTTYAANNPTLRSNHTQIIEKGFKVAMTAENAENAGMESRFARLQLMKMKEWKQNLEISATVGTLVSGTGTAARTMQGFVRFATLTTGHSGVSLTSDILNSLLGNAWANGGDHDTLLVTRVLKQRISGFTTPTTRTVDAKEGLVVGRVDVYDSDFGRIEVVLHRYIGNAASNTYEVMASYIKDYVQIGFLDEPHYEDRAQTGYFKAGAIVGEATVQLANALAAQLVRGLL
jgi:hypothetical protein